MAHELTAGQEFDTGRTKIPLDGEWAFSYDPEDAGTRARWFDPSVRLPERIVLPGCPQAHDDASRRKAAADTTGYLEAGFTKYGCTDTAWYRKTFRVPPDMGDRAIWLHIGGVTPAAEVWINGAHLGETRSSRCAVRCDVTRHVHIGRENTIAIRVFQPEGPRLDGLFDAYCYYGFTGIYRSIWLEAVSPLHITGIHAMGRIDPPRALICLELSQGLGESIPSRREYADAALHGAPADTDGNAPAGVLEVAYALTGRDGETAGVGTVRLDGGDGNQRHALVAVDMPGARLWDCDDPYLYTVRLELLRDGSTIDSAATRFGLREAYPRARSRGEVPKDGLVVTDRIDRDLLDFLDAGGRVLLISNNAIREYRFGPQEDWGWSHRFSRSYRSPTWNTGQHGNSGTVVRSHPALGGFPHHGWCDLSFVYLIDGAHPLLLEPYRPTRIDPIIRSIGHFRTMVDKAYLFETAVGTGRLLATSLRVQATHADHPESRYLLERMMRYASGPDSRPNAAIGRKQLEAAIVNSAREPERDPQNR